MSYWDSKRYFAEPIKSKYVIEKLGKHIKKENHLTRPSKHPENEFEILGVNNKEGLFDAYIEKGKNIKQPYQKVEKGWLAYNPYRVNVGSIGLKTENHEYDWISNAYVVFSCKNDLLPEFLYKIIISDRFNQQIRDFTAGSVRQNLTFDILAELEIPLPSKDIQEQLVSAYQNLLQQAEGAEAKANELEKSIESYLLSELGIEIQKADEQNKKGLQFVRFSETIRWDFDYLLNQHVLQDVFKHCKYKTIRFGDIIKESRYGISEKSSKKPIGLPMLRMNNIVNGELDLSDLKYFKIDERKSPQLLLQKNDFLFNRTNSKELVGKTAVFDVDGTYLYASYLIRLKLNEEFANVYFVNFLFNSSIVRTQIDMISRRILGQANINSTELSSFLIPLPSLVVQDKIVQYVNEQKTEIKKLRNEAEKWRKEAKEEFEREVFEN